MGDNPGPENRKETHTIAKKTYNKAMHCQKSIQKLDMTMIKVLEYLKGHCQIRLTFYS